MSLQSRQKTKSTHYARFGSLSAIVLGAVFACQVFASSPPTAEFKAWERLQKQGSDAFFANEYGKAERTLKLAVIKARELGNDDVRLAKSSGELGRLLTVRGRFSEAEPLLEEELKIKEQTVGNVDGKLVPAMGTMVRFYLNYGTQKKAYPLTRDVLLYVEGKIREESEERAKTRLEKGAPLVGWAGQAAPVMTDPLIEWAITCDDLGGLYRVRGDYDVADRLYKAALDVKATVLGKQHLSLANSYDSLGTVCMARGDNTEAESYFKEALDITQRILSPEHPQVYYRLNKLGQCLAKEGKYDEAETLYKRTRKFFNDPAATNNEPKSQLALGSLYCDQKKFGPAANALARALKTSEETNGVWSIENVGIMRKYAYVLYYLGRRGEADHMRARANNIAPEVQAIQPVAKAQIGVFEDPNKVGKLILPPKGAKSAKPLKTSNTIKPAAAKVKSKKALISSDSKG